MVQVRPLLLKDMYFGHIDAKHELRDNTDESRVRFREAFIIPDNVIEQRFLEGEKFIVHGLKGTGKTALLRYLGLIANDEDAIVRFILFRRELTEQGRQDLSHAADAFEVSTEGREPQNRDYESVWSWFLHRIVVESLEPIAQGAVIARDRSYQKYLAAVRATRSDEETGGLLRLLPRVKRGTVEVHAEAGVAGGNLGLEFDFVDPGKTKAKFASILRTVNALFDQLTSAPGKLYVMIDELELTLGQSRLYERDVRLIRDLLIAANEFNQKCREKGVAIFILVAVRSEVLTAVAASGKEINKVIEDFGTHITWHRAGNEATHPLLEIVARRINASERSAGAVPTPLDELWTKYFPERVQNVPIREYILHQTWYRPRDIVRLFNSICEAFPQRTRFGHRDFDHIRREYSAESWTEAVEELRTVYSQHDLDAVKRVLTGFTDRFTITAFNNRIAEVSELYQIVAKMLEKKRPGDILSDLYRVGVLGNYYQDDRGEVRQRWSFRGDSEALFDKHFSVHRALWASLSI